MTVTHFDESLNVLMSRRPFRPFTIELNTGELVEIDHLGAVSWRNGFAVFTSPGGSLVLFDHDSVNQIIDAPARVARRRPK